MPNNPTSQSLVAMLREKRETGVNPLDARPCPHCGGNGHDPIQSRVGMYLRCDKCEGTGLKP